MQKSNTDDYYRDICKNFMNVDISENDKDFISTIMTHGLVSGTQDDRSILAIQELMQRISGLPYDINLYRSGKMHPERRPYISASLSPEICGRYQKRGKHSHIHKITIKAGTPIRFHLAL